VSTETTHQARAVEADLDRPTAPDLPEDVVEVRRDGPLSAVVAALAGVVAVLFLVRAVGGGAPLDWVCALLVGAVAVAHAAILLDSRAPLMVLDAHGVRTRRGRVWEGIAWGHVARVEHTPRASLLRDGRLEFTDTEGRSLAVRLSLSTRLAGANWHELTDALVELADGHTHVVERAEDDRIEALEDREGYAASPSATDAGSEQVFDQDSDLSTDWLAGTTDPSWARTDDVDDVVLDDDEVAAEDAVTGTDADAVTGTDSGPETRDETLDDETRTPRVDHARTAASVTDEDETSTFVWAAPATAAQQSPGPAVPEPTDAEPTDAEPTEAEHPEVEPARDLGRTPAPLRDLVTARRSEVVLDRPETPAVALTPGHGTPVDAEEHGSPAYPADDVDDAGPRDRSQTTTIVFDDALTGRVEPVTDPVIGNELAAARTRLGLGVDQLAARTRIRPHVIEAIEVDDFGPCGGDFYARGHLRTLGRVLGVDPEPLVATYEERYSDAPIDPRRVFSSELAGAPGGSLRGTRGGFNWSLLVACVMAVVLVWSVARLLTGGSTPLADQPVLDGTPGRASLSGASTTVPVTLTAAGGGASLIVRDGSRNAKIVFKDDLAFGQTAELDVVPPVRISSTDGSVEVSVDGQDEGPLGETGQRAEQVFVPDE